MAEPEFTNAEFEHFPREKEEFIEHGKISYFFAIFIVRSSLKETKARSIHSE